MYNKILFSSGSSVSISERKNGKDTDHSKLEN
jgi:hypothetical protein